MDKTDKTERLNGGWTQRQADLVIVLVVLVWGTSYLLMKLGLDSVQPFCLTALRFGIAFVTLILIFFPKVRETTRGVIFDSAILGFLVFAVFAFLLHGMQGTSTSNASFLQGMTVVFVPIFHSVITRKLPEKRIAAGCLVSVIGLGFLTYTGDAFKVHPADLLCLCGAACYAVHVLLTSRMVQTEDGMLVGIWQQGFVTLYSLICTFLFETPSLPDSAVSWAAILGLAFLCSAFGFIMQPIAQRYTTPEHTGLLYTLEPVFAAILARIFLGERLSTYGYIGAALILCGVLLASARPKNAKMPRKEKMY